MFRMGDGGVWYTCYVCYARSACSGLCLRFRRKWKRLQLGPVLLAKGGRNKYPQFFKRLTPARRAARTQMGCAELRVCAGHDSDRSAIRLRPHRRSLALRALRQVREPGKSGTARDKTFSLMARPLPLLG